ncbi:MAG: amidohydrolase [Chloroflexi bacterium]|nr:amidohydrolase [Chloroflexota bacterium]
MYRIDCHAHFYDPVLEAGLSRILKEYGIPESVETFTKEKWVFQTPEERLKSMDKARIDVCVMEYHMVWQRYDEAKYPGEVRAAISRFINDRLAEVCQRYPDRYFMLADVPLMDVPAAISEANRCCELGAEGLFLHSHVHGRPLTSPEFAPFWTEVDRLGMPVFMHPQTRLNPARPTKSDAYPNMVNFVFDTTLAALDLLMDGFFDRYKRVKLMLCHCGGTLPFIKQRLDIPTLYGQASLMPLLDKFYYDTAISFPEQLAFTASVVGPDRVCFGTDYPFFELDEAARVIESPIIADSLREKIFSSNAFRFFGLA